MLDWDTYVYCTIRSNTDSYSHVQLLDWNCRYGITYDNIHKFLTFYLVNVISNTDV